MYTIGTLYQLQSYLDLTDGVDDARLLGALQAAAVHLERLAGRRFCPYVATLMHDITGKGELLLDDDLLALNSLTDTAQINLDDVRVLPGSALMLTNGRTFTYHETPVQAVAVDGVWGWHEDWDNAWRDSGDTVGDDPLDSTTTTITITSATGTDTAHESPRFQVGHLLKIGAEYLRVLAVTETALTVLRGLQGTTATTHAIETPIFTYQPVRDVANLHIRLAAWLYKSPDSRTTGIPAALVREVDPLRRV